MENLSASVYLNQIVQSVLLFWWKKLNTIHPNFSNLLPLRIKDESHLP